MSGQRSIARIIVKLSAALVSILLAAAPAAAQDNELICRLGVNVFHHRPATFDLLSLRAGWYVDGWAWSTATRPHGIEYVLTVQLETNNEGGYAIQPEEPYLATALAAHPGATWIIGNEPDRRHYQNDILPELYATAYHDMYAWIKERDPTARVFAGAIVQPSPLRLEYLDRVLASYRADFGTVMPADGWAIHNHILNERSCDYYQDSTICWGADIPPGIDAIDGMVIDQSDHGDLAIFEAQVRRFRTWMANNGYRSLPLYVSEYGILLPERNGFPPSEVVAFMNETFDVLLTAADAETGYPMDDNRLVQRSAWYAALSRPPFNGSLFASTSLTDSMAPPFVLSELGTAFQSYATSVTTTSDIALLAFDVSPSLPPASSAPVTVTLAVTVANRGHGLDTVPITIDFYAGGEPGQGGELITSETVSLAGCGDARRVSVPWPGLTPELFAGGPVIAVAHAADHGTAVDPRAETVFLFVTHELFLPAVSGSSRMGR